MLTRDQIVTYARQILNHVLPKDQTRGCGNFEEWEQQVPASCLSEKTRDALNLQAGQQICLEDIRSWDPGMRLGSKYTQGPGKDDQNWKVKISWPKFNRALIEIFCIMFGVEIKGRFQDATPRKKRRTEKEQPDLSSASIPHKSSAVAKTLNTPLTPHLTPHLSASPSISSGNGVLTVCLSDWQKDHQNLTLSALPLDRSHPPRLQVIVKFGFAINNLINLQFNLGFTGEGSSEGGRWIVNSLD